LQNRSSSDLQSQNTEVRKAVALAVKKYREKPWEEFGRRLDSSYSAANKVFWQTIRRLRGKRSNSSSSIMGPSGNILSDENEFLSIWKQNFEDLLNPVKVTNFDTHEPICFVGKGSLHSKSGRSGYRSIKIRKKAAGEDKIRPELLKALNNQGIL